MSSRTAVLARFRGRTPAVIVPLVSGDETALTDELARACAAGADLVEWRADRLGVLDAGRVAATCRSLVAASRVPVLATVRTSREGGEADVSDAAYLALVTALAEAGAALVDVELSRACAAAAVAAVHAAGGLVLASSHDFSGTPERDELVRRLAAMEELGADIAKVAVTPHSRADILALLEATSRRAEVAGIPLVTMAMGDLGAVTRVAGGVFGSAATFATVGESSAPGQLPVGDVRTVHAVLHRG